MGELWHAAEQDLIENRYRLMDTGQGLNRLQPAPRVSKLMQNILGTVQNEIHKKGMRWVGLSVVHLGDRDVPNALFFIDKYTQVPRILNPIVQVIERIPVLYQQSDTMKKYIDQFGGPEAAQQI